MKLNNDCIRDILLTLEELCTFENKFTYDIESQPPHLLAKYSREEVLYHIRQCEHSALILKPLYCYGGDIVEISDLSPSGHEYLANIRSDNIWNKTKKVAGEIGATSLSAMVQISSQIITAIIKSQFELT